MRGKACALVALTACGSSHTPFPNGTVDGPPPDTLPQAMADAALNAVTLTVTFNGMPMPNVSVYFQSSDSQLAGAATTDTQGTVGAIVSDGGFVTVLLPPDSTGKTRLYTYAGVRSGDALRLELGAVDTATTTTLTLAVPVFSGAVGYQIYSSCGLAGLDAGGQGSVVFSGCGSTADMIVIPQDDRNAPLASLYVSGVAVSDGVMRTLTGTYDPTIATNPTSFSYSGAPGSVGYVRTDTTLASNLGRMFETSAGSPVSGGAANNALALPPAANTTWIVATDEVPSGNSHGEQLVYQWDTSAASYSLNLANVQLPTYSAAPSYDAGAHDITWGELAGALAPDLVRSAIDVYRDGFPSGKSWRWSVVGPHGAGSSVKFPQLPVDGFDFNPGPSDTVSVTDLLTAQVPGGYDAFRPHGFSEVTRAISGTSGRIVVELLYTPPL